MSKFWSQVVHGLTPYVPGEQPKVANLIKLNTNENPFGPSPKVLDAIRLAANDTLRLYPDPDATRLRIALATYYGISQDEVFVGNGSDEVLGFVFQALLKHDLPLLFPDITYSFYPVYCKLFDIDFVKIPLDDAMEMRIEDYRQPCGAIIFPNPNAPTGIALRREAIATLLQQNPDAVVVVDEAYIDFGGETAIPLIKQYPNLLVVQTFSKSRSLAGLRVGFAVGRPELITALERVKNSFNSYPVDTLAIAGATAAVEDDAYFQHTRDVIVSNREKLVRQLAGLGFSVLPSSANFVFACHPAHDAARLAAELRERSIIVRHFKQPRIDQYLRISIGTKADCDALILALTEILASAGRPSPEHPAAT